MWLDDVRCEDMVQEAWSRGRTRDSQWPIEACIEECQASLKTWNKQCFSHVGKQIIELQRKLQTLDSMKSDPTILETVHATKKELNRWLSFEEEMWHQRSRNNWLKARDRNNSLFHTKASNQLRRNTINRIMGANNVWYEDME